MFLMPENKWARLLAYVSGLVNQKLLLQNEYLAAENRILRAHLPARMRLSDPERFARRGHRAHPRSHCAVSRSGRRAGSGIGVRRHPARDHRGMSRTPRTTGPEL